MTDEASPQDEFSTGTDAELTPACVRVVSPPVPSIVALFLSGSRRVSFLFALSPSELAPSSLCSVVLAFWLFVCVCFLAFAPFFLPRSHLQLKLLSLAKTETASPLFVRVLFFLPGDSVSGNGFHAF